MHGYAAWVACAGVRPDDNWRTRAVARAHGGTTKHTEIVIRYVCSKRDVNCKYCKDHVFPVPAAPTEEEMVPLNTRRKHKPSSVKTTRVVHYLSYGVTAKRHQQVFCIVGKAYDQTGNPYDFIVLNNLSLEEIKSMHVFLEAQVGKPFNVIGYNFNFICCCFQCGSSCKDDAAQNASWFCSELCSSALQQSGKDCFDLLVPCKTAPPHLVTFLSGELKLSSIPRIVKPRALIIKTAK